MIYPLNMLYLPQNDLDLRCNINRDHKFDLKLAIKIFQLQNMPPSATEINVWVPLGTPINNSSLASDNPVYISVFYLL